MDSGRSMPRMKNNLQAREQRRAAAVMMTPLLLTLFFLFLLPVAFVVMMSFTNWSLTTPTRAFVGLKNFLFVLKDERFWKALGNTVFYTAIKLVADTGLALFIATLLDRKLHLRRFFRIAHFAPVVVPITASSLIWLWFYDPGIGPLNQILVSLGLPAMQWLYSEKTALLSVILVLRLERTGLQRHPLPRRTPEHPRILSRGGAHRWSEREAGVLQDKAASSRARHLLRDHDGRHQLPESIHGGGRDDAQSRAAGIDAPPRLVHL